MCLAATPGSADVGRAFPNQEKNVYKLTKLKTIIVAKCSNTVLCNELKC